MDERVVTIGGGTGSYTMLSELKRVVNRLWAVVAMTDSGGSSRRLMDQFGRPLPLVTSARPWWPCRGRAGSGTTFSGTGFPMRRMGGRRALARQPDPARPGRSQQRRIPRRARRRPGHARYGRSRPAGDASSGDACAASAMAPSSAGKPRLTDLVVVRSCRSSGSISIHRLRPCPVRKALDTGRQDPDRPGRLYTSIVPCLLSSTASRMRFGPAMAR